MVCAGARIIPKGIGAIWKGLEEDLHNRKPVVLEYCAGALSHAHPDSHPCTEVLSEERLWDEVRSHHGGERVCK